MKNRKVNADIILIVSILVVALGLFVINKLSSKDGQIVTVTVNGVVTNSYSINDNGEYPLNGGTNILIIEDGQAYLKDANCPDKLCVKQGKIHSTGQAITCLPNKLVVEISGGEAEVDFES